MKYASLFFLILIAGVASAQIDSRKPEVVFKSVNVVPMNEEKVLADQTVVIRDGKISYRGKFKGCQIQQERAHRGSKGKISSSPAWRRLMRTFLRSMTSSQ